MKFFLIIGFSFLSILQLLSQDAAINFRKGNRLFNRGQYSEALDQFTKAVEINPENKDYRYGLAMSYLSLGDTCNACNNFKKSLAIGDFHIEHKIILNCIKFDELSYGYLQQASSAIMNENYLFADSLLSLSIESNHYYENHFARGLLRFYLGDTVGFCSDMRFLYTIDDAARNNCQTYCTDTIYFDESFVQEVDHSDYYEVIYKPGFGVLYNQAIENDTILVTFFAEVDHYMYWNNNYVVGHYEILNNKPVYYFANEDKDYKAIISKYFCDRMVLLKDTILEILERNELSGFSLPVEVIVSEDGLISDLNTQPESTIFKDSYELIELNNLIHDELERFSKTAPVAKPAWIGGRQVSYKYRIVLTFQEDQTANRY